MFTAVDSHTEGMPTRVITGGIGVLPGASMAERRLRFLAESDGIRRLLMTEPRGHPAMSGAILQPSTRPDADCGVLYIEVSGCLPMCGHGTMGVATVLVETGMVRGGRADHDGAPRHAGGSRRGRGGGRSRSRERRDDRKRPVILCRTRCVRSKYQASEGELRHGLRRQLLRHRADRPSWHELRPEGPDDVRRAGDHGRDQRAASGRATRSSRTSPAASTWCWSLPGGTARTPAMPR